MNTAADRAPERNPTFDRTQLLHAAVIVILAILLYANSLSNNFNFDDQLLLLDNPAVYGFSTGNLKAVLTSVPNRLEYLPVRDVSLMLDYQIWNLNPFGYHLSNLVYYTLLCLLAYLFLDRLLKQHCNRSSQVAFAAVLLYTAHPMHVEAVAGVAQRKDLLAGIFFLVCLLCYHAFLTSSRQRYYLLALLALLMALLSKASVVMAPFLLLLLSRFIAPETTLRRAILPVLPAFLITAVYSVIQLDLLKQAGIVRAGSDFTHILPRLFTACKALIHYLGMLIWPWPLSIIPHFTGITRFNLIALVSMIAVLALLLAAYCMKRSTPVISFALSWHLLTLLPVIGLIPASTVVTERYLLIPSLGFCLAAGYCLVRMMSSSPFLKYVSGALICLTVTVYGLIVHTRNQDWKDFSSLVDSLIRYAPGSPRPYWLKGREQIRNRQYDAGLGNLEKAAAINQQFTIDLLVFRADIACKERRYRDALTILDQLALPVSEAIFEVNYIRMEAYFSLGDRENARRYAGLAQRASIVLGIYPRRQLEDFQRRSGL